MRGVAGIYVGRFNTILPILKDEIIYIFFGIELELFSLNQYGEGGVEQLIHQYLDYY